MYCKWKWENYPENSKNTSKIAQNKQIDGKKKITKAFQELLL